MSNNRSPRFVPLIIAVSIVVGIIIGMFYTNHFTGNRLGIINTSSNKLNDLLRIIEDQYVDSVDEAELVENSMSEILSELDPHSVYISAKDAQAADDDLKGSFSGIGIQFTIRKAIAYVLMGVEFDAKKQCTQTKDNGGTMICTAEDFVCAYRLCPDANWSLACSVLE